MDPLKSIVVFWIIVILASCVIVPIVLLIIWLYVFISDIVGTWLENKINKMIEPRPAQTYIIDNKVKEKIKIEHTVGEKMSSEESILETKRQACQKIQSILKIEQEKTICNYQLDAILLKEIDKILCLCGNCSTIGEALQKLPNIERDGWVYKDAADTYNAINLELLKDADLQRNEPDRSFS